MIKMKLNILAATALMCLLVTSAPAQSPQQKLAAIFNKNNKEVLVAAHRGDWRHAPENTIKALQNSIEKKFDIMELDVRMTKDSVLIVMHDLTIDRTTNAKGKVSDYTLAELKKLKLRNGLGRITMHGIPTLKEMMLVAKDKIMINVDKGNDHLQKVFEVLRETGTMNQAIVNVGELVYDQLKKQEVIPAEAYLMVVVNMKQHDALKIIASYTANPKSIIQPIFDTDTLDNLSKLPVIAAKQVLWLNSLWPSLNGGHDDDRAVELNEKEQSWGWLLDLKPSILQTDRPSELLLYLRDKKRHR